MLVPALLVSSAALFVRSCSSLIETSSEPLDCRLVTCGVSRSVFRPCGNITISWSGSWQAYRSAFTLSSLSDASSGFQWPLPAFCFARESCLCLSASSGSVFSVLVGSWVSHLEKKKKKTCGCRAPTGHRRERGLGLSPMRTYGCSFLSILRFGSASSSAAGPGSRQWLDWVERRPRCS